MRSLNLLAPVLAAGLAVPAAADEAASTLEADFVACIVGKDVALARALKDAPSEDAFMASIRIAVELCPIPVEQLSMGRFFDALNAALKSAGDAQEAAE